MYLSNEVDKPYREGRTHSRMLYWIHFADF